MEDSDSSEVSDDSILGTGHKIKPTVIRKRSRSTEDIGIPAIFLVEGERNRKLLKQNDEIQNRILDDHQKIQDRKEQFRQLQLKVLAELNENGSQYLYTMRNDRQFIETVMERIRTGDPTLRSDRHFYYFGNVARVHFDLGPNVGPGVVESLLMGSNACLVESLRMGLPIQSDKQFTGLLQSRNIDLIQLAKAALVYSEDHTRLDLLSSKVDLLSTHVDHRSSGLSDESTEKKNSSFVPRLTLKDFTEIKNCLMTGIGCNNAHILDLRLVYFNNHVLQLVSRLRLIFLVLVKLVTTEESLLELIDCFIRSCSDFFLNTRCKRKLIDTFMVPIFSSITSLFGIVSRLDSDDRSSMSASKIAETFHELLMKLEVSVYNEEDSVPQKAWEQHYTFLVNIMGERSNLDPFSRECFDHLLYKFLGIEKPTLCTLQPMSKLMEEMSMQNLCSNLDLVTKNAYQIKVIVVIVVPMLNTWNHFVNTDLYLFQEQMLKLRGLIQQTIGSMQLSRVEAAERRQMSVFLSESYHDLEYLGIVFDKNLLLMRQNEFYQNE